MKWLEDKRMYICKQLSKHGKYGWMQMYGVEILCWKIWALESPREHMILRKYKDARGKGGEKFAGININCGLKQTTWYYKVRDERQCKEAVS